MALFHKGLHMTDELLLLYYRRRVVQEHDLAKSATCDEARLAHKRMASIYTTKLTLSYLDQANDLRNLRPTKSVE